MKSLLIAVIAAVLGSTFSLAVVGQAQTAKTPSAVAFVSATRVFAETAHGRSESARVQTMQQQRATELRAKQQALTATQQELMAAAAPARAALQLKETQQRAELERATQQANLDLQVLQREVNQELLRRIKVILDELMKTQSYQLVLNSDASLMWSSPELDLTNAVVSRMNAPQ